MKKLFTVLLFVALSLACGARSTDTTPEMAQRMLKLRGFDYSEEEFFKAIKAKDAAAIQLFLQAGINPNAKNKAGDTALTYAAANSDAETVEILIQKADKNLRDGAGNTPLFTAIKQRNDEIFNVLLRNGADPNGTGNAKNAQNQSALYVAVLREKPDLIKKLIEKGADPNLADGSGSLPISEVIISRQPDLEIFNLMLEKMTDVNKKEANDTTLLMFAVKNARLPSETRQEMIKALLAKGADKNIKDEQGKTALDWAKEKKYAEAVELLK